MTPRRVALALVLLLSGGTAVSAQSCRAPRVPVDTSVGMKYCADAAFDPIVAAQVQKIRADVRAARQAGRLIVYASTPISPRGGRLEKVHVESAAAVNAPLKNAL